MSHAINVGCAWVMQLHII